MQQLSSCFAGIAHYTPGLTSLVVIFASYIYMYCHKCNFQLKLLHSPINIIRNTIICILYTIHFVSEHLVQPIRIAANRTVSDFQNFFQKLFISCRGFVDVEIGLGNGIGQLRHLKIVVSHIYDVCIFREKSDVG